MESDSSTQTGTLLHKCMTKATTAEGDALRHSQNWLVSRRATLQVWSDRLVCGDSIIPYSTIVDAVLFSTRQMLIPCYILRVRTADRTYQFGLNPGRYWSSELPFPVRREKARLGYSPFSVALRVFIGAYLVYWLCDRFLR